MSITFASTFAGIGGFDLGFQRAGMVPLWHSEIDPAASKVLAHHWPEVPNLGDITRLRLSVANRRESYGTDVRTQRVFGMQPNAGRVDLLCGGFPCQDLSVAGRRKGLAGERSGLFHEFVRLAAGLRPRWVVIENVPGLLSSNQGRDFGVVLNALADLGYEDISWRVVDSLNLGVPQRRRRVLIVGHLGTGARTRQVLLEPEGRPWSAPTSGEAGQGVAGVAARGVALRGRDRGGGWSSELEVGDEAAFALRAGGGGQSKPHALIPANARCLTTSNERIDFETETFIASTLTASAGHHGHSSPRGDGTDNIVPVSFREDQRTGAIYEMPYMSSLNSGGGKPGQGYPAARVGARVRRLTPTECERLQGFPDGWTLPAGSDSARYRCLGNAVTVNVAEWLGQRIADEEAQR